MGSWQLIILICTTVAFKTLAGAPVVSEYEVLVSLYREWRQFEHPPYWNGAPDYRAETFSGRRAGFEEIRSRLRKIKYENWPVEQQADWFIVWAEMNGYDFNDRILQPWVRDPAFYKSVWTSRSDVPAHEGPTHHQLTEVWKYEFPLNGEARKKFMEDLDIIPPLNEQAKINLTGNARELWVAGIRDIKTQVEDLKEITGRPGVMRDLELMTVIRKAIDSTEDLAAWLEQEAKAKNGPSGIGKDNYTWYLQNVHLVPLTWEDEVMLLKRELARAWSALKLEEHRNRFLPGLTAVQTPDAYRDLAQRSAKSLIHFLEKHEILSVKEYFLPALEAHLGQFVPESQRNFFWITAHLDPRPLYSHFYHWFELAQMDLFPHKSEIRRDPLLYNIFDSRNEGLATAVEEIFMQTGLYDDDPRVKEIVYIMLAQRAARGLGSLYAHANRMTMEEAGKIHSEYTPRGWMKTEKELLLFEQHLYLRQPGYGTSYITGKYLVESCMAAFAQSKEKRGEEFQIRDFLDNLNAIGNIPVSLVQWQLTGDKEHLKEIVGD